MRTLFFLFSFVISFVFGNEESHQFFGKHYLASYLECDIQALSDVETLTRVMTEAVGKSGASILNSCSYVFPGNGLTMVFLLSESHASIHTYPEYGACFVDLFTCGEKCSYEQFDLAMRDYLKPTTANQKVFLRHKGIEEHITP
jgi:S-adenosylmethionine decarboxylase